MLEGTEGWEREDFVRTFSRDLCAFDAPAISLPFFLFHPSSSRPVFFIRLRRIVRGGGGGDVVLLASRCTRMRRRGI